MSLRAKSKRSKEPPAESKAPRHEEEAAPPPPPASSSQQAISLALASTAHLANLLPTGTLLAF
ncbi:hypothetical protein C4D60_Mb06t25830 [Musa balbisiana]|uniref:Uncharacterized protein n=1 Tax=Musa balbisiana TaxID=52838 RepID=A0A4S8IRY0_MUSBA|nr:hypothetical protein C4D60_Mb06t25830 [Musa balbisiana]